MEQRDEAFFQKIVAPGRSEIYETDFPEVTQLIRDTIREYNLESLYGLLGEDWRAAGHRIAERYWTGKSLPAILRKMSS